MRQTLHVDNQINAPSGQSKLEPAIFVIFGITGDLAQHRLLPALYHLMRDGLLHEHTEIVGVTRRGVSAEALLAQVELCVLETDKVCNPVVLEKFRQHLRMLQFDAVQAADYDVLLKTLNEIEDRQGMCMNRLFYLAIPPQVYEPVIQNFGLHHLQEGCPHLNPQKPAASGARWRGAVSRLLVEKPFGYDLASAADLVRDTAHYFKEEQVFRIDHYLAKETVQNILVFRQQNPIFASLWDSQHITAIEIDWSESTGVEGRASFYDNVGALRDVVQNHLLQILSLVAMELPENLSDSATVLHHAKQQLLADIKPVDPNRERVTRAQYAGYREEVGNPRSTTETFVHVVLAIDNDRWRDVPITITAGKALKTKKTTVAITFRSKINPRTINKLTFRIQPNEGIDIELTVKRPGFENKTEVVQMDFSYHGAFAEPEHPDAYERVLVDAVRGDHSLFATSQEVLESWRILQPILTQWEQGNDDLLTYEPNSDGPMSGNR